MIVIDSEYHTTTLWVCFIDSTYSTSNLADVQEMDAYVRDVRRARMTRTAKASLATSS